MFDSDFIGCYQQNSDTQINLRLKTNDHLF